jgi:AcrR family transcriptional regulator
LCPRFGRHARKVVDVSAARTGPSEILDVVVDLLEAHGYDGWQLRDVAELAHVSLATVYKYFPSREELIVAAVERWMDAHIYQSIQQEPDDQPVFDAFSHMFRAIFKPWEKHPRMLEVFVQACATTGRDRLRAQGNAAVERLAGAAIKQLDPAWAADVSMILTNVTEGALSRYLQGEISVTDILPSLERTLYRLQQGSAMTHAPRKGTSPPARPTRGRRGNSVNR